MDKPLGPLTRAPNPQDQREIVYGRKPLGGPEVNSKNNKDKIKPYPSKMEEKLTTDSKAHYTIIIMEIDTTGVRV